MVRSVPITEVDDETLYALLRQGGEQFKAELAARPALSPTATVTDPAHERPAHLLDFAKRFYPGYESGRLHEVMAAEIEAALSQYEPCPDCGDLDCFACGGLRLTGELLPCLLCWCDTCGNTGRVPSSSPYWLMVEVPPQHGKALALDTPIPTPDGWRLMGDLRPGDRVFAEDGAPCTVVAVSPVWRDRPVYEVRTDDGDTIIADAAHEWVACLDRKRPVWRRHTTEVLARPRGKRALIRAQGALAAPDADLPIPPYVLGAWLGDGTSAHATITQGESDIAWMRAEVERCGVRTSDRATAGTFGLLGVVGHLRALGVLGNKHIPAAYLRASEAQRRALLQGIVDTDGHVGPRGQVEVCSTSAMLADGVLELVRSLGVKARISTGRATINGRDCGPKYRVMFYMAGAARMPRKATRCRDGVKHPGRYVYAVAAGTADTVCIQVDSPSHMFLAGRSMLPTHNSELVSVQAPAWYLGNHPDHQWVQASYAANLAETHSRYSREIVSSADYDVLYGLRPSTRTNSVADWTLQGHRGGVRAVGVGGGLTGRRADVLVIDDPIANLVAAYSENTRETVWGWWRSVARTRLHPHSVVILVMTRWHYDDLAGRLLAEDKRTGRNRWRVVRIPARADEPTDPLGRAEGAVVWPERFRRPADAERFYDDLREDVGPVEWAAMYQQRPTLGEGAMFKGEYWSYYDPHTDMPAERLANRGFQYVVQLWDTAFKDKSRNDFNACVTFGVHGGGIFVLDVYNARHELPALLDAAAAQATKWGPTHLLAENKASGPSMVQMLRVAAQRTYVELWEPPMGADKVARAAAVIPMLSQRRVYLPRCTCGEWTLPDPLWLNDFLAQLYQFPAGAHDDMVDSFTGGLHKVKELEDDYRRAQVASTYSGGGRGSVAARYIDRDTGAAPSPELVRRR